ncbi:hypothetical protein [Actinacidiphila acidipaludis]|uniref:Uncharacterized protein n=1 Tax=Actinacidiphila acidipaludis TaxID=2873382 RepID=A0ABS7QKT9_9ACTN|nr:hypothetical protein [Streptomyces acidipaludis]MBY8882404.1 hypothetical protein [Streptomyces acidipaludis]
MTHYPMTHIDLTQAGNDGRGSAGSAAAPHGRHARPEPATHHAAGSLPAAHILLLSLSALVVLAAALLVTLT